MAGDREPICLMYLTGQHDVIPSDESLVNPITHVALAFMRSGLFLDSNRSEWPSDRSVDSARQAFATGTKILVAIGGWGDTDFSIAARDETSRKSFAGNVARMVEATGADGVDIDWEYPGGNGEDYKQVPNSEKEWEIEAYPLLLGELRSALGPSKLITAAVPGIERDMIAFRRNVVHIEPHLDFLNVMTYDLMNRRDDITKHHSSIGGSRNTIMRYIADGVPREKINFGLGFYVKWFKVDKEDCDNAKTPIGCKTLLLEDPVTGGDLGRAGAFSWHDEVPEDMRNSFQKALLHREYDDNEGATCYYDSEEALWWTFDDPHSITKKVEQLTKELKSLIGAVGKDAGAERDEL
ncbi:hypothetical protein INS49_002554 [Diaporthe citri]|uniref:uncharacterized protein n=1 Tax=Diaporthe citri TaxID=83186 RepID=UPI001C80DB4E|nr:uncharacterized protein INS49_002554 [Diaporthe citri]KAG6368349.1 hypothetical protein INS49_002554 [Diaporthe citri]